jgi:hypothetical protein
LIKGHLEARGVYGAVEPFIIPGRMPDHRLRPCFGGICSRTDLAPHELDADISDRARKSSANAHEAARYELIDLIRRQRFCHFRHNKVRAIPRFMDKAALVFG